MTKTRYCPEREVEVTCEPVGCSGNRRTWRAKAPDGKNIFADDIFILRGGNFRLLTEGGEDDF